MGKSRQWKENYYTRWRQAIGGLASQVKVFSALEWKENIEGEHPARFNGSHNISGGQILRRKKNH